MQDHKLEFSNRGAGKVYQLSWIHAGWRFFSQYIAVFLMDSAEYSCSFDCPGCFSHSTLFLLVNQAIMIKKYPKYDWSFARLFSTQTNPKSSYSHPPKHTPTGALFAIGTFHWTCFGCGMRCGSYDLWIISTFPKCYRHRPFDGFYWGETGRAKIDEMCQGHPLLRMLRMLGCSTLDTWFQFPAPCHEVFGNCRVLHVEWGWVR